MARIPRQMAQQPLSAGGVVQFPSGTAIGPAISQAGNVVQNVAERWQKQGEEFEDFKASRDYAAFKSGRMKALDELEAKAEPGAMGMTGQALEDWGTEGRGFLGTVSPRLQERYQAQIDSDAAQFEYVAAGRERDLRYGYYRSEVGNMLTDLQKTVSQIDPDDTTTAEVFRKQGEDGINATGLPSQEKQELLTKWREGASDAVWQALLLKDPAAAKAALGIDALATSDDVVDRIIGVESSGRADAKNPNSTATGLGQFTSGTWMRVVRQYEPQLGEGKSRAEVLALRNDPAVSRRMVSHLANESGEALRRAGLPVTDGTVYLAHFLGSDGATAMLRADPGASAPSVNAAAANANKTIFYNKGPNGKPDLSSPKTAGEVVAWADRKMGSTPAGVDRADPRFQDIPWERRFQLYRAAKDKEDEVSAVERVTVAGLVTDDLASVTATGSGVAGLTSERVTSALGEQKALQWADDRNAAESRFAAIDGMATMTDEELSGRLDSIRPTAGAPGFDAALNTYDAAETEVAKVRKQRTEDPAQSVGGFPEVKRAVEAWDVTTPEARATSWTNMLRARISAQERVGIVPALQLPLTEDEAKQFSAPIKAATALAAAGQNADWFGLVDQLAAAFKKSFGEYQDEAFRQVMVQLVGGDEDKALYASKIIKAMLDDQAPPLADARAFDEIDEISRTEDVARQLSGEDVARRYSGPSAGPIMLGRPATAAKPAAANPTEVERRARQPGVSGFTASNAMQSLQMPEPEKGDVQFLKDHPETMNDFISIFGANAVPREMRSAR